MGFRQFGTFHGAIGNITRDQFFRKPVVFYDKVTFEWATNRIVIEDGTIKGFTLITGADIISANWDGSDPLVLSTPNAITAGYAFDDSLGTAQFAANLFVGTDTSYIAINGIGGGSDAIVFHDEQGAGLDPPLVDAFIVHDVSDQGGGIDNGLLWLNSFAWSGQDGAAMLLHGTSDTGTSPANVSFHIGGAETMQINKLAMNPGADSETDMGIANLRWDNVFAVRFQSDAGSAAAPSHSFHGDDDTGIYRTGTDAFGMSTSGVLRGTWSNAGLDIVGVLTGLPWKNWTPTILNFTLGNGTLTGRQVRVGDTIHCYMQVVLGSTSSVTGTLGVVMPVAPAAGYGEETPGGTAQILEGGIGRRPALLRISNILNRFILGVPKTNSTYGSTANMTATVPFTWTTGDGFGLSATYEGV